MSTYPTVADVRAAITSHAPGPAHPAGPSVADVRARLSGRGPIRGNPAAQATTENIIGTEFLQPSQEDDREGSAPAPAVPARAAGSNSGDPAIAPNAATESPGSPLDHAMPGHAALAAAGIDTIEDLRAVADLTRIKGIGRATARSIEQWLEGRS